MRATKEGAKAAMVNLHNINDNMDSFDRTKYSANIIFLQRFIEACEKRLPSEDSVRRDKERRKVKK